jgi:hypothetical protein
MWWLGVRTGTQVLSCWEAMQPPPRWSRTKKVAHQLLSLRLDDCSIEGKSGSAHPLEESPSVAFPMMVRFLPNPGWWQREVLNPLLSNPTCVGSANNMASNA